MPDEPDAEELEPQEMQRVLAAIFKRSQTDVVFRSLCLEDPGRAVFEISGKRLPPGSTLRFAEPEKNE